VTSPTWFTLHNDLPTVMRRRVKLLLCTTCRSCISGHWSKPFKRQEILTPPILRYAHSSSSLKIAEYPDSSLRAP
jgi:hypothetical protein